MVAQLRLAGAVATGRILPPPEGGIERLAQYHRYAAKLSFKLGDYLHPIMGRY